VPFPPHTAYNELVGASTPHGTPRVPSPTPAYYDLYYITDVPDYFIDPDSLVEHFAGTTLSVKPIPDLSSVPGAFSPSPSSPDLLSSLLPFPSAPAVSGGSQDGLTSDNSEDDASSVDAHLSVSSRTSPVPVPYTPAQQITASNPTICPLITTLAPLVTVFLSQPLSLSPTPASSISIHSTSPMKNPLNSATAGACLVGQQELKEQEAQVTIRAALGALPPSTHQAAPRADDHITGRARPMGRAHAALPPASLVSHRSVWGTVPSISHRALRNGALHRRLPLVPPSSQFIDQTDLYTPALLAPTASFALPPVGPV
jgi:hypothetical protein